jgi:hypothetical protein
VDTALALCTRNYHFFAAIAKWYSPCVAKIFLPEDYSPIILSGIIQDDKKAITTDLPMAFQFHLPYLTKDGSQTSFIVVTGPKVILNTVLCLPLIKTTTMIANTVDKVVDAKHLDCPLSRSIFSAPQKLSLQMRRMLTPHTTSNSRMCKHFGEDQHLYCRYGAHVGGSKTNAVNLILRLFLYHILHTMSL